MKSFNELAADLAKPGADIVAEIKRKVTATMPLPAAPEVG